MLNDRSTGPEQNGRRPEQTIQPGQKVSLPEIKQSFELLEAEAYRRRDIIKQAAGDDSLLSSPELVAFGRLAGEFRAVVLANPGCQGLSEFLLDVGLLNDWSLLRNLGAGLLKQIDPERAEAARNLQCVFSLLRETPSHPRGIGVLEEDAQRVRDALRPLLNNTTAIYYLSRFVASNDGCVCWLIAEALSKCPERKIINALIVPALEKAETLGHGRFSFSACFLNNLTAGIGALDPLDSEAREVLLKIARLPSEPYARLEDQNAQAQAIRRLGSIKDEPLAREFYGRFFNLGGDTWNIKSALASALSGKLSDHMRRELKAFAMLKPRQAARVLAQRQKGLRFLKRVRLRWNLRRGARKAELFDSQVQACLALELQDPAFVRARVYELTNHGNRCRPKASWFAHHEGIEVLRRMGWYNPRLTDLEHSLSDALGIPLSPGDGKRLIRKIFGRSGPAH